MNQADARIIRQRFEAILERMGKSVRLIDQRLEPVESLHLGYLTRGAGPEAEWEFRFLEQPAGMQSGAILCVDGDAARWHVDAVHFERQDGELLFVSAIVSGLEADAAETPEDLGTMLVGLRELLGRSTLGPLERDDATEALDRLPKLFQAPMPEAGARLKARLTLLGERFKACPQSAHEAKGRLLRLEALLKRKGLL